MSLRATIRDLGESGYSEVFRRSRTVAFLYSVLLSRPSGVSTFVVIWVSTKPTCHLSRG